MIGIDDFVSRLMIDQGQRYRKQDLCESQLSTPMSSIQVFGTCAGTGREPKEALKAGNRDRGNQRRPSRFSDESLGFVRDAVGLAWNPMTCHRETTGCCSGHINGLYAQKFLGT